ncbi:hypothetical protein MMPV_001925 [Pyropia vietnamensis]
MGSPSVGRHGAVAAPPRRLLLFAVVALAATAAVVAGLLPPVAAAMVHASAGVGRRTPWSGVANPLTSPTSCGRPHPSVVCDADGLLPPSSAAVVDGLVHGIRGGRPPYAPAVCGDGQPAVPADAPAGTDRGYAVGVAVVASMDLSAGVPPGGGSDLGAYARRVYDAWGVGDTGCGNGVLLLLGIDDRAMYIVTGSGARRSLTEARIDGVYAQMRPALRAGKPGQAVEVGVAAIGKALAAPPQDVDDDGNGGGGDDGPWWLPVGLFVAAAVGITLAGRRAEARKRARYAAFRSALRRTDSDRSAALANRYEARSCAICLQDFPTDGGGGGGGATTPHSDGVAAPLTAAGAASVGAAAVVANGGGERPDGARRPRTLACGHVYCDGCISAWVASDHGTCPICRAPVTDAPPPAAAPPSSSSSTAPVAAAAAAGARGWAAYRPELAFRAGRLRSLYPEYVPPALLDTWEREGYHQPLGVAAATVGLPAPTRAAALADGGGGWAPGSSFGGGLVFGWGGTRGQLVDCASFARGQ